MRRALQNFFHRPVIQLGVMEGMRGPCRNPRFVSFLAQSNVKPLDTHYHDAVLRGRKLMRHVTILLLIGGVAWFAVESARALSVF